MVSFQCEGCGDVLTKKKTDSHYGKCKAPFTCIDCHVQFHGTEFRNHTSCMTEAQKYQGALYKEKKPKANAKGAMNPAAKKPLHAYVEDADDSFANGASALAKVEAPPHAPTPPPANTPLNVFDFLDSGKSSRSSSMSSSVSSYKSLEDSSSESGSDSSESDVSSERRPPHKRRASDKPMADIESAITYGSEPVERSLQRFESDVMQIDGPTEQPTKQVKIIEPTDAKTPGGQRTAGPSLQRQSSDKKRKRLDYEDYDTAIIRPPQARGEDARVLHSGLTGGLTKMLSGSSAQARDASPTKPEKRSKRSREETVEKRDSDKLLKRQTAKGFVEERRRKKKDRTDEEKAIVKRKKHGGEDWPKAIEGPKDLKQIEYHTTEAKPPSRRRKAGHEKKQRPDQPSSEYFLSLVGKEHKSIKGQSLLGTLKMFRQGQVQREASTSLIEINGTTTSSTFFQVEEQRLLKGLRLKMNKKGEIVLFARPESEFDL